MNARRHSSNDTPAADPKRSGPTTGGPVKGSALDRPLPLPCGVSLPNRLVKAAMTEGLADANDWATEAHVRLYGRWSEGGAGLLITGNVMVDRRYLERPGNVVVDGPGGHDRLRAWARAGTEGGNHLWMQISHPGRQATKRSTREPLSPSDVQLDILGMFARPRAMTEDEIDDAVERFVRVALVARDTGFTGVQIHGAHGYLISQFLSPVTNRRSDRWGGSLPNRARFLLSVVRAVRRAVEPAFPVAVKLNSADFQKGGFTLEECVEVASWLADEGIDLLEISGGTYEQPRLLGHRGDARTAAQPQRASTRCREAYFLEYASAIRSASRTPLLVTGGFRSRRAMLEALDNGELDAVGLARPLCVQTDAPRRLLEGTAEVLPTKERGLHLRPRLLGPASPLFLFKVINIQGEAAWFYRQIVRLGEGQDPDLRLGLLRALYQHLSSELRLARARRYGGSGSTLPAPTGGA
jgi:2,4-dienoyl-CoA reductase-like NADH-dependent reductase (Old Yellow Enzyme family)